MKGTEKLERNMKKERDKGGNKKGEGIIGIYLDEKTKLSFFQFLCLFSIITSPALIVMYLSTYERYYYPYTHNLIKKKKKSKRSMWILVTCIVGMKENIIIFPRMNDKKMNIIW